MRLITFDDIIETYFKVYHRGFRYLFTKFSFSKNQRTKSTFNSYGIGSSNYWIIPRIRERWNLIISGDGSVSYEDYLVGKYLNGEKDLNLLSLGSGICSHEMIFAKHQCFESVKCVDFSEKILEKAEQNALVLGLKNMVFESADVSSICITPNSYDVILFHSSLHHFNNIPILLEKVRAGLKSNGLLVINEYVGPNRLQINENQINEINRLLKNEIPKDYRKRFLTNTFKNRISGSGVLRMIITDPSEAVQSSMIIPTIRGFFDVVEEKNLGGDLLMWLFKDISHHFIDDSSETNLILSKVFQAENEYLKENVGNFVFGIYRPKTNEK